MLKHLQSQLQKLPPSNPKPHHVPWWLCAVMTALVKNAPKLPPLAVVAMASPAASLGISQALAVTANQVVMVAVKALHRVAHVWAMPLSVRNVMRWNRHKMRCVA
jgi:hypothetical protein